MTLRQECNTKDPAAGNIGLPHTQACFSTVLFVASTLAAGLLHAADYAANTDFIGMSLTELADVEVRVASLLPTTAAQAGSTVDIVQRSDWQKRGARRMLDTVAGLPAVMVLPMHLGADALAIRGYGGSSSYPGTALQWDGVPLNGLFIGGGFINLSNLNLGTLNRVELIRGPGSALHGSDAYYGMLDLHAFESDQDLQQVGSEVASNGFYEIDGRLSTRAFADSRLNLAVAGSGQPDQHRHYDFIDPATTQQQRGERANDYAAQTLSIKLDSTADEFWGYHAGLYAHHYDAKDFSGLGTALSGNSDLSSNNNDFLMSRFNLTRYVAKQRSLEMQTYAWQSESDAETRVLSASGLIDRRIPRDQWRGGARAIYRDAQSIESTRWALAAGVDRLEITDAEIITQQLDGLEMQRAEHPASGAQRTIRQITLDADTRWNNEKWRLVYGGRLDDYSDVGSHFSPRLGLITQPRPNTTIKFLYGNAFRAPAAIELYGSTRSAIANPNLDPEILDSYELVLLMRSKQWRAQLEIFHSRARDAIVPVASGDGSTFIFVNQDHSTAQGISLGSEWQSEPWTIQFNCAYTKSENTSTDQDYGLFPRITLNVGVGYDFYQYDTQVFVNQFYYSHTDDVLASEAGFASQQLPGYARTDITITHRLSKELETFGVIRNLLDRDNRLPSAMGSRNGIPDERASVGAGFRYSF